MTESRSVRKAAVTEGLEADVVLVGLGPTGAALAAYLGRLGVRVVALERSRDVFEYPRAGTIDGEIMRIFQAFGVAERLERLAHRAPPVRYWAAGGEKVLAELPLNAGPRLNWWQNAYMIHQPDLDRLMRQVIDNQAGVTALRGCEARSVELEEGTPRVVFRDVETGEVGSVGARYVVGCEGGRSLVRRTIGARNEVLGEDFDWLFVDLELCRELDLPELNFYVLDPARPVAYLRKPRRFRRFYFRLLPGEDPTEMASEDGLWRLLEGWVERGDAEVVYSTVFRFHSLVADRWRRGPLFIAGDAAHQMAPTLGQGLCSGMRDAGNLAWKLAAVLAGQAPESLLDTYEAERMPHARLTVETSYTLAGMWSILDPQKAEERDERLRGFEVKPLDARLGPGLHPETSGGVGTVFPQDELRSGWLSDEEIGLRFALVDAGGVLAAAQPRLREELAELDVAVLEDPGPEARRWLEVREAGAALIRPDRYVLGLASAPEQLEAILARVPRGPELVRST